MDTEMMYKHIEDYLDGGPAHVDELAEYIGLETVEIGIYLWAMERDGIIKRIDDEEWTMA